MLMGLYARESRIGWHDGGLRVTTGLGRQGEMGRRSRWQMRSGMAGELEAASHQLQYSALLWEERWSEEQEMERRINRAGTKMAAVIFDASLVLE